MALPLMRKATAVWLVENTSLTFSQIANFCGLHELEVSGIADGEVASGIRGMDPITSNQLTEKEIKRCELDPNTKLELIVNPATFGETKRRGPRYTPLSKRQDKPAAIAWLVKFYPDLPDSQIIKLVGTTKPTIKAIRERSHWNITNIVPTDPVLLGLCKQVELDTAIKKIDKKNSSNNFTENLTNKENLLASDNNNISSSSLEKNDLNKEEIIKNAESLFEKNDNS